jgi:hypothetical protein
MRQCVPEELLNKKNWNAMVKLWKCSGNNAATLYSCRTLRHLSNNCLIQNKTDKTRERQTHILWDTGTDLSEKLIRLTESDCPGETVKNPGGWRRGDCLYSANEKRKNISKGPAGGPSCHWWEPADESRLMPNQMYRVTNIAKLLSS